MQFSDLPEELVLKIFSYLSHGTLLSASHVSRAWKLLALNPVLWTEITIDTGIPSSPERLLEVLGRATLLRTLDISCSAVNLDALASVTRRFQHLNKLVIQGRSLSHPAIPRILRSCGSLTSVVLRGRRVHLEEFVTVLESASCLKSLEVSDDLEIADIVIRNICTSCPRLEKLKISTRYVLFGGMWSHFEHLKNLSVTSIYTNALLAVSRYCPNLESLAIRELYDGSGVSPAQAFQAFPKLKSIKFKGPRRNDWFLTDFLPQLPLECVGAPPLFLKKGQVEFLVGNCRESLRELTFNAAMRPTIELKELSAFINLESICIHGLTGILFVLSELCTFPKLMRAKLMVERDVARAAEQLPSIADVLNKPPRSNARLVLNFICTWEVTHEEMIQAVRALQALLSQHASLRAPQVRHLEEQCSHSGNGPTLVLDTAFPVKSQTLKYLELNLDDRKFAKVNPQWWRTTPFSARDGMKQHHTC